MRTLEALDRSADLRESAVDMLSALAPQGRLSRAEARVIVQAMRPLHLAAEALLFREGDAEHNDFMALVLEGHLRVEGRTAAPSGELTISVIGPGQIIGEMGVIDEGPRSASCVALTDVKLAVLSRAELMRLIEQHPAAGACLALTLARSLAARVREGNRRLHMLSQLMRAAQGELDAAHSVNRRLLRSQATSV